MTPRPSRASSAAPLRTAIAGLVAAVLLVAAAWLGVLVAERIPERPVTVQSPTPSPVPSLPSVDVAGDDIPDLGRFPGSVRTTHMRERQGSARVTVVEYVAAAEVDDVRTFYRRVFRENGWELVELDVESGEWVFLVERQGRAALIEIERAGTSTLVQIEVEVPIATATPRPTPTPRPEPPPPAPPGDDDDDDGGADD